MFLLQNGRVQRCEPPFCREASHQKKPQDCGRCERGTISPRFNVFLLQNGRALYFRNSTRFIYIDIHASFSNIGSLPGSTGKLWISGWDIDNRIVTAVNHHFIERLPQKKTAGLWTL